MPQYHLGGLKQTLLSAGGRRIPGSPRNNTTSSLTVTILMSLIAAVAGCKAITERQDVRPLVLRDVPAQRLAYRFEADIGIPKELQTPDLNEKLASIQADFTTAGWMTRCCVLVSPDGQRALALRHGRRTSPAFRIDLYATDGRFLRNLIPPTISCVFRDRGLTVDGNFLTFIAHKSVKPAPTPTPPIDLAPEPESSPRPAPSVAPVFPAVAAFNTEQIYICNRWHDLKALTARGSDSLLLLWAPTTMRS